MRHARKRAPAVLSGRAAHARVLQFAELNALASHCWRQASPDGEPMGAGEALSKPSSQFIERLAPMAGSREPRVDARHP
jgi:hypothetical protein